MRKTKHEKLEERAKTIAENMKIEHIDQFNWRLRKDLTDEQVIAWMRVLSHFISIPTNILNDAEIAMFSEDIFEKINVSNHWVEEQDARDTE